MSPLVRDAIVGVLVLLGAIGWGYVTARALKGAQQVQSIEAASASD